MSAAGDITKTDPRKKDGRSKVHVTSPLGMIGNSIGSYGAKGTPKSTAMPM